MISKGLAVLPSPPEDQFDPPIVVAPFFRFLVDPGVPGPSPSGGFLTTILSIRGRRSMLRFFSFLSCINGSSSFSRAFLIFASASVLEIRVIQEDPISRPLEQRLEAKPGVRNLFRPDDSNPRRKRLIEPLLDLNGLHAVPRFPDPRSRPGSPCPREGPWRR